MALKKVGDHCHKIQKSESKKGNVSLNCESVDQLHLRFIFLRSFQITTSHRGKKEQISGFLQTNWWRNESLMKTAVRFRSLTEKIPTCFVFSTSSGTKASWNLTLCRTWSKTERSRPCPTTSSCSTSSSRSPNNVQRIGWVEETSEQGLVYVCVHIYVCVCDGTRSHSRMPLSPAVVHHSVWERAEPERRLGPVVPRRRDSTVMSSGTFPKSAYRRRNLEKKLVMIITSGIRWISVYSYRTMLSNRGIVQVQHMHAGVGPARL